MVVSRQKKSPLARKELKQKFISEGFFENINFEEKNLADGKKACKIIQHACKESKSDELLKHAGYLSKIHITAVVPLGAQLLGSMIVGWLIRRAKFLTRTLQ